MTVCRRVAPAVMTLGVLFAPACVDDAAAAQRKATIVTTASETVEGQFQGASDTGVALGIAGQRVVIPWDSISQLYFVGKPGSASGNPLGLTSPAEGTTSASRTTSGSSATQQNVSSGRCQAITKKGTQCSRKAKAGSNYCWQHGG